MNLLLCEHCVSKVQNEGKMHLTISSISILTDFTTVHFDQRSIIFIPPGFWMECAKCTPHINHSCTCHLLWRRDYENFPFWRLLTINLFEKFHHFASPAKPRATSWVLGLACQTSASLQLIIWRRGQLRSPTWASKTSRLKTSQNISLVMVQAEKFRMRKVHKCKILQFTCLIN